MSGLRAIFVMVLASGWLAVTAQAHRLTVEWQVAEEMLEIHATTEAVPAAGAIVELRSAAGALLVSASLDETGHFRWPLNFTGGVTVVVNAGLGHRRTLTLTEADLQRGAAPAPAGAPTDRAPAAREAARAGPARGSSDAAVGAVVRVGLGLTFLLALAAAGLSYGNARRLAALERRLPPDASRD